MVRNTIICTVALSLLFSAGLLASGDKNKTEISIKKSKIKLKSENDSLAYSFGLLLGSSLANDGLTAINDKVFIASMNEQFNKVEPVMTPEVAKEFLNKYFMAIQAKKENVNIEAGKKFLSENAKKDGIVVTESGLQYKILKKGEGNNAKLTDIVSVHYKGTLIDGTTFDSSYERGEPVEFPLNGVIKGWQEGLQLMNPGSKYMLFIPSELGYGDQRMQGSPIAPNSVLIFEVELLSAKAQENTSEGSAIEDVKTETIDSVETELK